VASEEVHDLSRGESSEGIDSSRTAAARNKVATIWACENRWGVVNTRERNRSESGTTYSIAGLAQKHVVAGRRNLRRGAPAHGSDGERRRKDSGGDPVPGRMIRPLMDR